MQHYFSQPMNDKLVVVDIHHDTDSIDFSFKNAQWFYDIPISSWKKDYPFWQDHMRRKRWFTPEMENFINSNTKDLCKTETD